MVVSSVSKVPKARTGSNGARRPRATIRDVAARAGCSPSTVSRVLNGVGRASQETKERVSAVAQELGFRFDPIGRSLQSQKSRTLGLLTPTLTDEVFAHATGGVQAEAHRQGYQVLLACSNYDVRQEEAAVANLIAHRVDGLVMTLADTAESPALLLARDAGIPFVLVFNQPAEPLPAVSLDNRAAGERMAREMMTLGHREAAFISGRFRCSERARHRYDGFKAAFLDAGHPAPALLEVDRTARSHRRKLMGLMTRRPGISALFCSNDVLALTVVSDLRALGCRVPEDMSVAGFDGIDATAVAEPSIATIAISCGATGKRATTRLIAASEGREEMLDTPEHLPFRFRPGSSLGRPNGMASDARRRVPARKRQ
ncbi:MAG: LacI family DNA-binding transcriptional regulator [Pseudomonadota bacterium]